MSIEQLNQLPVEERGTLLTNCCAAKRWVEGMLAGFPYADTATLLKQARSVWSEMEETDWLQAFDAHPKIGDVSSLKEKYAATRDTAGGEQSSVDQASDQVIEELAAFNTEYEARHGFIFIVFATGKSASEMLQLLKARIDNSRDEELVNAAGEQIKITLLRLEKLL